MSFTATRRDDVHATANLESQRDSLVKRFRKIRGFSQWLAEPLSAEDCAIQSMPDVSPIRWHLAHTTWFFETFLLKDRPGYRLFDPRFEQLFNSYYNAVGQPFPRHRRGQISRPGLHEILEYRQHVENAVVERFQGGDWRDGDLDILELGLQHEQQHQELVLTDIKHVFFSNPLRPTYRVADNQPSLAASKRSWCAAGEGVVSVGYDGQGFAYDNESPRHRTYLQSHALASRCVTNGEYLEFMQDSGYSRPELWLSLGWSRVVEERWEAPLYWLRDGDAWCHFTLGGITALQADEPVCHVSYFEADAFARWSGHRLPTEFEWEHAASSSMSRGAFADVLLDAGAAIHPRVQQAPDQSLAGMLGDVWEWTSSHYSPYPGYRPAAGALGEYNGKFMCNQFVLRGGSCATSSDHIRSTYRNFFPPETRWQFSGIRLARDEASEVA